MITKKTAFVASLALLLSPALHSMEKENKKQLTIPTFNFITNPDNHWFYTQNFQGSSYYGLFSGKDFQGDGTYQLTLITATAHVSHKNANTWSNYFFGPDERKIDKEDLKKANLSKENNLKISKPGIMIVTLKKNDETTFYTVKYGNKYKAFQMHCPHTTRLGKKQSPNVLSFLCIASNNISEEDLPYFNSHKYIEGEVTNQNASKKYGAALGKYYQVLQKHFTQFYKDKDIACEVIPFSETGKMQPGKRPIIPLNQIQLTQKADSNS